MTEEPEQPEGDTPEEETPEGAPGEPGEGTPSETAPEAPDAETPPESDAPGPEIEGLEELEQAAPGAEAPEEPEAEAAAEPEADAPAEPDAEAPAAPDADAPAEADAEAPAAPPSGRRGGKGGDQEEVIPGLHLEPDLVLEEQRSEGEFGEYDQYAEGDAAAEDAEAGGDAEAAPVAYTPLELAADARYHATGKRKSAIARVILKPGEGTYTVNGRHLDEYFPRIRLQRMASQPLEAAGYQTRMDVVARIHGGGVSAQANALRHGIARALVEADPALRAELKRRGYLTRDPREKERKKAGLKKARKRPQFSKR